WRLHICGLLSESRVLSGSRNLRRRSEWDAPLAADRCELESAENARQSSLVGRFRAKRAVGKLERHVLANCNEFPRQTNHIGALGEGLATLATDLVCGRDHRFDVRVARDQVCRALRTDALRAGNVVRAVADE